MTRIVQLTSENVKRVSAVKISPQGNLVVIGGDNAQGKSSVLDSIAMALGGGDEIPAKPVRIGEEKARIVAELDNGLIIKRTFTAAGGTALVVENKEGARYPSPQAMLDGLTGRLSFDPLAFTRLDAKKRAETLRRLLNLNFAALDTKRKALYDERTLLNKNIARVQLLAEAMPFHGDAPKEPVSTADVLQELENAKQHNAQRKGLEDEAHHRTEVVEDCAQGRAEVARRISDLEAALAAARKELAEYDEAMPPHVAAEQEAKKALAEFVSVDEAPIRQKLADASLTNKKVHENTLRADAFDALKRHQNDAAALTAAIEVIDKEKADQLAAAPFPIVGLSFDENGVTFNGLPFEQSSAAEQLRVSVAIGAALNPKLRVMLVRDGSLLDEKSMGLLAELAEQHNLQVWIERVSKGKECSVIIEDGAVAAPVVEAAPATA